MLNLIEFESLFKQHYAELVRFGQKYLSDYESAEEIVQNLFVKFWENRNNIKIEQSHRAYLFSATRNACLNEIKHQNIKTSYINSVVHATMEEDDVVTTVEVDELDSRINNAINQLPEGRRKIFLMSRHEGMKYKEIALALGLSIKTVENQMGNAIKHLRNELKDYLIFALLFLLN